MERDINVLTGKPTYRKETWVVFLVILIFQLCASYYLMYIKGFLMNDAMARTGNAFFVLHILPRKLASIGFVWNPLPSMLQLPIVAFAGLWKPLASHALAGSAVTSTFSAISSAYIYDCFRYYKLKRSAAILIVALYSVNPFIVFYGANGMSEAIFFTMMIVTVGSILKWIDRRATIDLLLIAFMLTVAFLTRYETFALAAGVGVSLLIIIFFMKDPTSAFGKKPLGMKFHYMVSTCLVVFLPVLYTVLIWIFLNATIMDDPLYFLSSAYSNSSQSNYIMIGEVVEALTSVSKTIGFVLTRSLPFLLPVFAAIIVRIVNLRFFKLDFLIYIIICAIFIAFHYVMLLGGSSYGWLRFFSFSLPISMCWIPYELSRLKNARRTFAAILFAVSLLASAFFVNSYFSSVSLAPEEFEAFQQTDSSGVAIQREVAQRINDNYTEGNILMDAFKTTGVVVNLDDTKRVIINTSEEFDDAIRQPWKYDVRYFVVTDPSGIGSLDAINKAFPELYEEGADWCVEEEEVRESYKIYRIVY